MNLHAGQLPCPLVVAAEPTTLVFFDKHDFVNVFDSEQITNLLDTVHKQDLINDVQESELILRSMTQQKLIDIKRPRKNIFLDRDTPERIRKIVRDHEMRELSGSYNFSELRKQLPKLMPRSTKFRSRKLIETPS